MTYCVRKFREALTTQYKQIMARQIQNFDEPSFLLDISSIDWNLTIQCSARDAGSIEGRRGWGRHFLKGTLQKNHILQNLKKTNNTCVL